MLNFLKFWHKKKPNKIHAKQTIFTQLVKRLSTNKLDKELLISIEKDLLTADVGFDTTQVILQRLQATKIGKGEKVTDLLEKILHDLVTDASYQLTIKKRPHVIMMVGINGVGKTTTTAKLANYYKKQGNSVMLAAADTFRAAAIEQLSAWAKKLKLPIIAQQIGADSSAVLFDAVTAAKARKIDVLIADTAGRLQNKTELMEQLAKNIRVMQKVDSSYPHDICLVIDANNGQNVLQQVNEFHNFLPITNIICTKCDSSAKAGTLIALADKSNLPISFLGSGESIDDLQIFEPKQFIENLLT